MMASQADRIDLKILQVLEANARLPLPMVAGEAGVSQGECADRMIRLQQSGHIGGYTIVRNYPDGAAQPVFAVIRIVQDRQRSGHDLLRSMDSIAEITTADVLDSDHTVLVRVQVRDLDRLDKITAFFRVQSAVLSIETTTTQVLIRRPAFSTTC